MIETRKEMALVRVRQTTPSSISQEITNFLAASGLTGRPEYLRFKLVSSDYRPRMCLENCEAEAKKSGRTVQFGWVIWEIKSASFIEAEFHAVVRKGSRLIDITPRIDGEDRILFVPDAFRNAIRIAASEWLTWTNIKSSGGIVQEQARQIRIVNLCQ